MAAASLPLAVRARPVRGTLLFARVGVAALVLLTAGLTVSSVSDAGADNPAALLACGLAMALAAAVSTRVPLAALLTIAAAALLSAVADPDAPQCLPPLLIVASYQLGRRAELGRVQLGVALALVLFLAARPIDHLDQTVGSIAANATLMVIGPAALGRGVRDRGRLREAIALRAAAEEGERHARQERALVDERARIAGELHDVVAHALSAMVVQASGARTLARRDPSRAGEAFASVESTGRDALFEIRSLLGVLRRPGDEHALEPQPSLESLDLLVARSARAGLPATLEVSGEPSALSPGLSLAGYRAVQDALRSARDEGGAGSAAVRVAYEPGGVRLEVSDDGPGAREPLGARERVALYGGELSAAHTAAGHRIGVRLSTAGRVA